MKAFVNNCSNAFGYLSNDCRTRLEAVLDNPTQDTWDNACSIIINGDNLTTLWQAWIKVDPNACLSKKGGRWPVVPSQFVLYKAIKYATKKDDER